MGDSGTRLLPHMGMELPREPALVAVVGSNAARAGLTLRPEPVGNGSTKGFSFNQCPLRVHLEQKGGELMRNTRIIMAREPLRRGREEKWKMKAGKRFKQTVTQGQ